MTYLCQLVLKNASQESLTLENFKQYLLDHCEKSTRKLVLLLLEFAIPCWTIIGNSEEVAAIIFDVYGQYKDDIKELEEKMLMFSMEFATIVYSNWPIFYIPYIESEPGMLLIDCIIKSNLISDNVALLNYTYRLF